MKNDIILPKIIYIAGYGRSGSTVLDIILGNHPEILSTGEICHLFRYLMDDRQLECTCGKIYRECALWQQVLPVLEEKDDSAGIVQKLETLGSLPKLFLRKVSVEERDAYKFFQQRLYATLAAVSDKNYIVDSSQSSWPVAGRFLALSMLAELDVYVIHLVRNGLDNVQSIVVRGSNRALEGQSVNEKWASIRAPLGWVAAHLGSSIAGQRLKSKRYLRVRYEDFVLHPEATLAQIGQFCGFDSIPLIESIRSDAEFQVSHMVGGNRVRFQKSIRLQKNFTGNYGENLSYFQRVIFYLLGGLLHKYYGYGKSWENHLE